MRLSFGLFATPRSARELLAGVTSDVESADLNECPRELMLKRAVLLREERAVSTRPAATQRDGLWERLWDAARYEACS